MAHALASDLKDDTAPPRVGWERPPEEMGYVAVEDFRRGRVEPVDFHVETTGFNGKIWENDGKSRKIHGK